MRTQKGLVALLAVGLLAGPIAAAAPVTISYSSTVGAVNPGAAGFPSSLQNVQAGDTFEIQVSYDTAAGSITNPFSGFFGAATLYETGSMTATIDGVLFAYQPLWIFVWNGNNPSNNNGDGIFIQNKFVTPSSTSLLGFGNTNLSANTFATDALPSAPLSFLAAAFLQSGVTGDPWVTAVSRAATVSAATAPVPLPAAAWLLLSGIGGLSLLRRRKAA